MMMPQDDDCVTIAREDLVIAREALMARFQLRHSEARRVAQMREMLAAAAELVRVLGLHTQHGLVHCHGTPGNSDLTADTQALFAALSTWGARVHAVAAEYRQLAGAPAEPAESMAGD